MHCLDTKATGLFLLNIFEHDIIIQMKHILKRFVIIGPIVIGMQLLTAPMMASAETQITIDIGSLEQIKNCQASEAECERRIQEVQLLVQTLLRQIIESQYPDLPSGSEYYKQDSYLDDLEDIPLREGERTTFDINQGVAPDIDRNTHPIYRETWRLVREIVPDEYLDNFNAIRFYNDKDDRYSALVRQRVMRDNEEISVEWRLDINLDNYSLEQGDYNDAVETITHEAGHVLLMNATQMEYFVDEDECDNYYVAQLQACAQDSSYYEILMQWWDEEFIKWGNDWAGDLRNPELAEDLEGELRGYYEEHEGEFVSAYAATGPNEDAAEVIAHVAMEDIPKTAGTIAEKKMYALLTFEEILELRERVQQLVR